MRAVNLLPENGKKKERQSLKLTPMHGAGAGILVGALALGYWGHSIAGQVAEEKLRLEATEQQVTMLTAEVAAAKKKNVVTVSSYETDKALISGLASARVNWSTVIINLSRVAPKGVWLTSLGITTPTGGAAAAGGAPNARPASITLEANAKTRTDAALFLARLNGIRGFVEPRLSGGINGAEGEDGAAPTYSFTVLIPIDDAIFGPGKAPVAPAATPAPSTTTPPTP